MDRTPEIDEQELTKALDELTVLLPMYSYTQDNSKLSVTLAFDPSLQTPPKANYLAAKGILYRFPFLQQLFPAVTDISARELAELHKSGEACPFHTKSGKTACPALRSGKCSLAKAACPWDACRPRKVTPVHCDYNHINTGDLSETMIKKDAINAGAFDMPVLKTTAYTIITCEGESLQTRLTEFELQVLDAICSLWHEAEKRGYYPLVVSYATIYKVMPGCSGMPGSSSGGNLTEAAKERLYTAMEHLRSIKVWCNLTDACISLKKVKRAKDGEKQEPIILDDMLIGAIHSNNIIARGQRTKGYIIQQKPLILDYSEITGQYLTVPAACLAFPLPMTEKRQAIAGYIVRRIAKMKYWLDRSKKDKRIREPERTILFSTVFEDVGLTTQSLNRSSAKSYKDFVLQVLDYEKQQGWIHNYAIQQKGKRGLVTGVTIQLEPITALPAPPKAAN